MRARLLVALLIGLFGCSHSLEKSAQSAQPQPRKIVEMAAAVMPPPTPQIRHKNLKIYLAVASLDEIKVTEGSTVTVGQTLADRNKERQLLLDQKKRLEGDLAILKTKTFREPSSPHSASQVANLPQAHFEEQDAEINKAKAKQKEVQHQVDLKRREINYIKGLSEIDAVVLEHENKQLDELTQLVYEAANEVDLARGKLQSAKDARAYKEYERSLAVTRQSESLALAQQNYERTIQEWTARKQEHETQVSNLVARIQDWDLKLAQAPLIQSPYAGIIRKLRFKYQNENKIEVELLLAVNLGFLNGGGSRSSQRQQPGTNPEIVPAPPIDNSQRTQDSQSAQVAEDSLEGGGFSGDSTGGEWGDNPDY